MADHLGSVRDFLAQRLLAKGDSQSFADGDSLFVSGRLDSLDAMETVVFLEEEFGLDFAELGFDMSLIDTPATIVALIARQS